MQYFVMTCSNSASPISSDQAWKIGTVTRKLVTSSIMHKIYLWPLYDQDMAFKSMFSLDIGI